MLITYYCGRDITVSWPRAADIITLQFLCAGHQVPPTLVPLSRGLQAVK